MFATLDSRRFGHFSYEGYNAWLFVIRNECTIM